MIERVCKAFVHIAIPCHACKHQPLPFSCCRVQSNMFDTIGSLSLWGYLSADSTQVLRAQGCLEHKWMTAIDISKASQGNPWIPRESHAGTPGPCRVTCPTRVSRRNRFVFLHGWIWCQFVMMFVQMYVCSTILNNGLSLSRQREGISMCHLCTTPLKDQLSISKILFRVLCRQGVIYFFLILRRGNFSQSKVS